MMQWLIGIILGEISCKSSNWPHIQRLQITILGANWQLFRLERIAKCSYFILSTQNIEYYWFVMKIKKFLLPIWWHNRGSFPLGNTISYTLLVHGIREISTFWFHIPWGRRPNGIWNQNVDISRIPWEQAGCNDFIFLSVYTHIIYWDLLRFSNVEAL